MCLQVRKKDVKVNKKKFKQPISKPEWSLIFMHICYETASRGSAHWKPHGGGAGEGLSGRLSLEKPTRMKIAPTADHERKSTLLLLGFLKNLNDYEKEVTSVTESPGLTLRLFFPLRRYLANVTVSLPHPNFSSTRTQRTMLAFHVG